MEPAKGSSPGTTREGTGSGSSTPWATSWRGRTTSRTGSRGGSPRTGRPPTSRMTTRALSRPSRFLRGERYALSYDSRGRLTSVRDGGGLVKGFEYDAQHNL